MKNDKDNRRVATIAVAFAIFSLILLASVIALGSYEISKIKESVTGIAKNNAALSSKIDNIAENTLTIEDITNILPENGKDGLDGTDGINGSNGKDGRNGKDSISTHTIEKETKVIEKIIEEPTNEEPPAREIQLGISLDGKHLWKYKNNRDWQTLPIVNITIGDK